MSGTVDEAVCEQARQAMATARRAEYAVLESVRALAAAGVAEAGGYRNPEALIGDLWPVDLGEARRLVHTARALTGSIGGLGEPIEPLVHHGGWQVEMRHGRPRYTPPRWIDPRQRPRPGGPALL